MTIRGYVLDKLYGNTHPSQAVGLETAIATVYTVLEKTVVQRRGQQCVLLGARSTGKTLSIEKALARFKLQYPNGTIVVRINGLSHSDDRLALREIAKQFDTALSHNGDETSEPLIERPSMSQTLKAINQLFSATAQQALDNPDQEFARVVFVIEELDRYISSHQVLVYELLDLSLTSPTGVAVIATSTRLNILDLLEKRNRSRNFAASVTLGKPASLHELITIGQELLKDADGKDSGLVTPGELNEACTQVWFTTNSVRHLQALLIPLVLGPEKRKKAEGVMIPSTSASLLKPVESVPEMDWALLICAARAVLRYETASVNLVLVLDEWRALFHTMQVNRFADLTARSQNPQNGNKTTLKPGSTPASLLAVRHSWERLRQMGLLEPTTTQSSQEDLRMYVPELNLDDLRGLLPKAYTLYNWTRLEI